MSAGWRNARRPGAVDRRIVIGVVIAALVAAYLVHDHRISRFQVIYFLVLIPSIILHEISHGAVALLFGDDTARRQGRLSLNPVRHVDPVGTIIVPAVLSLAGVGAYGWAKPVPVNTSRLRSPRNHTVVVSLAGPLTNLVLAGLAGLAYVAVVPAATRLGYAPLPLVGEVLLLAGLANLVLAVFNLVPCPPLDGAAVLERLIPARHLGDYYRLQPALMFLPFVLVLLFQHQWISLVQHLYNWWAQLFS
ncbi:MAG: site-2 protease family protein [Actinomycetota bacterium]|jgi:Zn-dependent protease|nr:site-2 protease family protein [Actinomycetota bacterium]